jgi:hypothetical protein
MALKFGSKAWRAKYMKKNRPKKRKKATKRNRPNTYTRKGAAAKRKRLKQMIRKNPPRKWTNVKQVRVIRRAGKDILEIRK